MNSVCCTRKAVKIQMIRNTHAPISETIIANILKPQDGKPVISPSQDMVIGCYYLSCIHPGVKGEGRSFANEDEAMMAYLTGQLHLQAKIKVRISRKWDGEVTEEYLREHGIFGPYDGNTYHKTIETSLGRLILNGNVPQDMGDRKSVV